MSSLRYNEPREQQKGDKNVLLRYWEKTICLDCSWMIKTCRDNSRPQIECEGNIEKAPADKIKLDPGHWYSPDQHLAVMHPHLNFTDLRDLSIGSRLQFRATLGLLGKVYTFL